MTRTETARQAVTRLRPWLRQLRHERPPAVILGGSCNGLSFARSLGRRGIPTILLDSSRLLGTFTRFGKVVLLPSAEQHSAQWISFLKLAGQHLPVPGVLFSTSDLHTLLVSENRDAIAPYFRFLVPDANTVARLVNKRLQYESARAAGVPIPAVWFPQAVDEVLRDSGAVRFPCLLKPYVSHTARAKLDKQKVVVVQSRDELVSAFARLHSDETPLMIQELIPGDDTTLYGYLAYWDEHGREIAWVTKRKLRQFPQGFGDGSLQETVEAPQVAAQARRLLRQLGYRGFVGVEFRSDARDGSYRLIEINPRTVSGNQLAIEAGVDFPWIGYQHLLGRPLAAARFQRGVKYVNEEWDLQAFLALRRTGQLTLAQWLRSISDTQAWALGAWDDPKPLLAGAARTLRVLRHASDRS